jgi:protein-L-isoaspartate(D-aspartate) O-methyltransferase
MGMDYAAARRNMVESQLRPNKVTDPALLEALATVPRELFVPAALRSVAYVDEDVPLGRERFLMEPMIFGRLAGLAAVQPTDAVLLIGVGLGYGAAVLARLADRVIALESDHDFAQQAVQALQGQGAANVAIVEGPLAVGAPRQAPFDAILFDGAVDRVPAAILDQLGEGGRLAAVARTAGMGQATLMTRRGGIVASRVAFDAAVRLLPGFAHEPAFVF